MYITPISYVGHIRSMSYDPIKKQSSSGSLALGSLAAALMGQTSPTLATRRRAHRLLAMLEPQWIWNIYTVRPA